MENVKQKREAVGEYVKEGMTTNASGLAIMDLGWERMQQKVFTKWVNNQLKRAGKPEMGNLVEEMETGIPLMNLINALYETPMPKYNKNPRMRIHKVDNTANALRMVENAEVKLKFVKNTHLVDKDKKMILGMTWQIIHHYQIAGISEEDQNAKEALLLWCQKKTRGYEDVDVKSFRTSFNDGLALCALINRHRPDLLDFSKVSKDRPAEALELAFSVAEKDLDIPRLLDVEDLLDGNPDERSVITYISEYYHKFSSYDKVERAARRVGDAISFKLTTDELKDKFLSGAEELKKWIGAKTDHFSDTDSFPDDTEQLRQLLRDFDSYKSGEKAQKTVEKADLEAAFNQLQSSLAMKNRPAFVPPAGLSPHDINADWNQLTNKEIEYLNALHNKLRLLQESDILLKRWRTKSKKLVLRSDILLEEAELIVDEAVATSTIEVVDGCLEQWSALRKEETDIDALLGELQQLSAAIREKGLTETKYTQNTLESVTETWNKAKQTLDEREPQLHSEVESQRQKDAVRKEFAEKADAFYNWAKGTADKLAEGGASGADYEARIEQQNAYQKDIEEHSAQYDELRAVQGKVFQAGIISNQYTSHTFDEIAAIYETLPQTVSANIRLLQESKMAEAGRNVAPEALAEYQSTFKHFDKNNNQALNKLEFKSCMQALGHPLDDAEVNAAFAAYPPVGDYLKLDAFIDYVVGLTKDTGTAEQVEESFQQLADGNDIITEEQLRRALQPDQVEYCLKNMPKSGDGYDYKTYAKSLFSDQ